MSNAVIFCCDANYFWPAAFAANRVADLSPDRDFAIRIFCSDPIPADFARHAAPGVSAETLSMGDFSFFREFTDRISNAAFLRIFALDRIAADHGRVVYYDVDVVFRHGDLSRLFTLDLGDKIIGAVRDTLDWAEPSDRDAKYMAALGVSADTGGYFNSGFLLVDCARWAAQGIGEKTLRFIAEQPELCRYNDQSALNHALAGKWAELSPLWNWQAREPETLALIDTRDPHVVHFNARQKPWRDSQRVIPAAYKDPFRDWGRKVGWTLPAEIEDRVYTRRKREEARAFALSQTYAGLADWVSAHNRYLRRKDFIDSEPSEKALRRARRAARRAARGGDVSDEVSDDTSDDDSTDA